jgi:putative endonuclease
MPFTYIVRCADNTFYVGHTQDLASREKTHNEGKGGNYTARRTPVRMVYAEEHVSIESAVARERQLKRWTRKKKEALIDLDQRTLSSCAHKQLTSTGPSWRDVLERMNAIATAPRPPFPAE